VHPQPQRQLLPGIVQHLQRCAPCWDADIMGWDGCIYGAMTICQPSRLQSFNVQLCNGTCRFP
jgi:hypothetical protein